MRNLLFSLLLGALTAAKIIAIFLFVLSLRARHAVVSTGAARMVGLKGKAVTPVEADGRVSVQGEYWWGRSRTPIAEGEKVIVVGIEGLTLEVEPCPDKAVIPRPVSALEPRETQDI